MKHIIIKTVLASLLLTAISACDSDNSEKNSKKIQTRQPAIAQTGIANNTAEVVFNHRKYTLPVRICNTPRTDTFKGQSITHYSIIAQDAAIGAKTASYPIFSISGVTSDRGNISNYKFEFNSKGKKTAYSGQAPYDIFENGKLHYKGKVQIGKQAIPIEINIKCR